MESIPGDPLERIDLAAFALLKPASIRQVSLLRETGSHLVCRVTCGQDSYILKWFKEGAARVELQVYALLSQVGVETLPVHGRSEQALLLEDLNSSPLWRQASEEDMGLAETGKAVGEWYRQLHRAGRASLSASYPDWLRPWVSVITAESLEHAGAALGLQAEPAWQLALETAEALKASYLARPQTFNYSDFAAENLALSRGEGLPRRAIVFDYDCFTSGAAASDCRNVLYSLRGAAKPAFQAAYGPVDESEFILDEPLAILDGLVTASRLSRLPGWATPLLEAVAGGELERAIRRALGAG